MIRLVAATILTVSQVSTVFALETRPIPKSSWSAEAKLTLARAWVGEADWNFSDHVAIGWVLAKRWRIYNKNKAKRIGFGSFVRLYCSPLKGNSSRQRQIQALPWGDPRRGPYRTKLNVRRWRELRKRVELWGQGLYQDPCPRALHWGGTMDKPFRNWRPVSCGDTNNTFYRIDSYSPST